MSHIFISYRSKDVAFAGLLEHELEAKGYSVWRDKSEIRGGDEWVEAIKDALSEAWAVIVVQSPDAEKSEWVGEELQYAENHDIPVIPILLRGEPWFGFLRKQFIDIRSQSPAKVPAELYDALPKYAPAGQPASVSTIQPPVQLSVNQPSEARKSHTTSRLIELAGLLVVIIGLGLVVMDNNKLGASRSTPSMIASARGNPTGAAQAGSAAKVTFRDDFKSHSLDSSWIKGDEVNIGYGSVSLFGGGGSKTFLARMGFTENMGALITFDVVGGDYYFQLYSGESQIDGKANSDYRAWILDPGGNDEWIAETQAGDHRTTKLTFKLKPNEKYQLLLGIGKGGHIYTQLWAEADSQHFVINDRQIPDDTWANRSWTFNLTCHYGQLTLYNYQELHFPDDYQLSPAPPANVE